MACVDNPTAEDQSAELNWGTAALCIENPIAPGDSLCYHIEFKLDTLAGESELAKRLSEVLRDSVIYTGDYSTVQQAIQAFADSTEAEWKQEIGERYAYNPEYKDILQYYYTVEGYPEENGTDSILSYVTKTDCYLGGAHGSFVIFYYNFDKKTGKLLNINDIIPEEAEMLALRTSLQRPSTCRRKPASHCLATSTSPTTSSSRATALSSFSTSTTSHPTRPA